MIDKTYDVGIYCRLSNDDERDGESVSIENQKLLLQNYVRQRGWNEVDVYIDDGYSGTNFNRPGVKRLIEDAKAKRINLILVKDLSRFGRNYIEFGQYTDYLFPSIGCRFIALNNGIDTMSDNGSTDVMCFLNLFNEFYSRDTSKKPVLKTGNSWGLTRLTATGVTRRISTTLSLTKIRPLLCAAFSP